MPTLSILISPAYFSINLQQPTKRFATELPAASVQCLAL